MDHRKTVVAALVLGFGVLAAGAAQAQAQMDQSCVRAVESEVRGRYAEAVSVDVGAVDGRELSDLETGFSGAGHFEDEEGNRTTFSFDCISNARTGQAYGVTLSEATPQPRSSAARQARRGPLSRLIAAIANRGRQGSRDVSANEASAGAGKAAAIAVEPLEPVEDAPPVETASVAEDASELEVGTPIEGASRAETASPVETPPGVEAAPPVGAASSRTLDGGVIAPYLGDLGCTNPTAIAAECSREATAMSESREAPSAPRSTLPLADAALSRIAQDLPTGEVALLRFAAHATTAASMCSNIELNNEAVVGTLSNVVYATASGLTPRQAASRRDAALVAYGILTGLMLQEAAANHAAFCADAVRNAGEAESWSFIRVTDAR